MELQSVSIALISRFHFHYSPQSTDRKWCSFAIQKITKAIFATPTKQILLADEEFSSETHITQQHGITEREYCVYLTFSFSLFTSFNRQEVMFVCHSKDNKSYLRDTNKTIFASRWSVFLKNPHNSAAWNYRTWVLRLSHVFIFIIHLIQQTGNDVCWRFERSTKAIFTAPTKQFLLADDEFSSKTHITQQHGITEREYCVNLALSFSIITSFNRQELMFVCDSKDNKTYLRDTNETIFASRWRVFIKKIQITEQHGITGEYCVYLTFSIP